MNCQTETVSANTCDKVLALKSDGTGLETGAMNGDDGSLVEQRSRIYNVPPGFYYVDVEVASTSETAAAWFQRVGPE